MVRIVAPHFVAGFESDGKVVRAAPILRDMIGMSDAKARARIKANGWTAHIVVDEVQLIRKF
ncbi:hypothetical protein I6F35_02555 [Bradyrhizobium sp. BRP22]|uniref:hypothetical protein n=1 Tax=Bradyrhizobium sp. BRP22 TaxID=2793821 RepID=UPI001CD74DCD|nr:hypothetical protein [Bradyrhizobium sp. BRP22]MCA1452094.1 hypothetical protein [Bradyrhizobium sp. BRP22]